MRRACLAIGLCSMMLMCAVHAADSPLRDHISPYLAQHADDPVRWRLWDAATLAEARKTGRPIFLSSGYFACHWCHVMQRESFRDPVIAALLNEHFIPVKIDRELWPALDGWLIDFARSTRGQAGWPLNVVLTPTGDPLFAMLYAPPDELAATLKTLQQRWVRDRETLTRMAAAGRRALQAEHLLLPGTDDAPLDHQALRARLLEQARAEADELAGGFGGPAKFPHAPRLLALLELERRASDAWLGEFLHTTLDHMADGGLRDHLAGGFFRYSVDPHWREPHFEKMLYDNAQLALVYLRAATALDTPRYRAIAFETLDFITAAMCTVDGLCAAALSAVDAAGVEGGYYLWSDKQLAALFNTKTLPRVRTYFQLQGEGFAAGHLPIPRDDHASTTEERTRWRDRLLQARGQRQLPVDDKQLCGWNGLLLGAYAEAAQATGGVRFLPRARALFTALEKDCLPLTGIRHVAGGGGEVTLDDVGQLAFGLSRLLAVDTTAAVQLALHVVIETGWCDYATPAGWRVVADTALLDYGPLRSQLPDAVTASGVALLIEASRVLAQRDPQASLTSRIDTALQRDVWQVDAAPLDFAGTALLRMSE